MDKNDSGSVTLYENGKAVKGQKRDVDGSTYNFNGDGEATVVAPKQVIHIVEKNDSLWSIARKYKVSMVTLAKLNGKTIFSVIHPGDKLIVPQG